MAGYIGSLAPTKILLSSGNTNTPAAFFSTTTMSANTTGNVVPVGIWLIPSTANVVLQANNGTAMVNVGVAGAGGFIISDGINVQLLASANVASVTLIGIDGGIPITNTFIT
jgi:hypothetical protein